MSEPRPLLPRVAADSRPVAAIFLSGSGSNAEEILKRYRQDPQPPFTIAGLVTDAPERSRARELGEIYNLPVAALDIREFYRSRGESRVSIATERGQEVRREWTDELRKLLAPWKLTFAIFAGFVPLTDLTADLPCLNVHPGDLTYLKDGQRWLVGLHQIPVERALLEGLDYLASSVIIAMPVTGAGGDMDSGPILGVSAPMDISLTDEERSAFQAAAAARDPKRPAGGYHDALEEYASQAQDRLKTVGDWVVFPPVIWDFAQDRYYIDDADGQLLYRTAPQQFIPVLTVEHDAAGHRELRFR